MNKKGFTLIELLIVIGIIAILAGAVIITINPGQQFSVARDATRRSHLNSINQAILSYQVAHQGGWGNIVLPNELTEICNTNLEIVDCLEDGLVDISELVPDYINQIPIDPQGGVHDNGTGYFILGSDIFLAENSESSFIAIGMVEEVYLEGQPFQVASANDLQKIGSGVDGWNMDSDYVQVSDINWEDYSNTYFTPIGHGSGSDFTVFEGTFDGGGYNIDNLKIDKPGDNAIGLFAAIQGGFIENINLNNIEVVGTQNVGGLAGLNTGTIENCFVSGTVEGGAQLGGLIGYSLNNSLIDGCHSEVDVSGTGKYVGGLTGALGNGSLVTASSATGTISTEQSYVGGLVGAVMSSDIEKSFALGDVYGGQDENDNSGAGGLVGLQSEGTINMCYARGDAFGTHEYAAGLVAGLQDEGEILNSFSTGDVEGAAFVGGLVGANLGAYISKGYTTGNVPDYEVWSIGGIVGWGAGSQSYLYFDKEKSIKDDCSAGEPRTTAQMKAGTENSYISPDGTVDETQDEDNIIYEEWSGEIWDFGTDEDYPELIF